MIYDVEYKLGTDFVVKRRIESESKESALGVASEFEFKQSKGYIRFEDKDGTLRSFLKDDVKLISVKEHKKVQAISNPF